MEIQTIHKPFIEPNWLSQRCFEPANKLAKCKVLTNSKHSMLFFVQGKTQSNQCRRLQLRTALITQPSGGLA